MITFLNSIVAAVWAFMFTYGLLNGVSRSPAPGKPGRPVTPLILSWLAITGGLVLATVFTAALGGPNGLFHVFAYAALTAGFFNLGLVCDFLLWAFHLWLFRGNFGNHRRDLGRCLRVLSLLLRVKGREFRPRNTLVYARLQRVKARRQLPGRHRLGDGHRH